MKALFKITNKTNYSIAEFIVDTNLFLDWIDIVSEQEHIALPFGEVDVISWDKWKTANYH